MNNGNELEEIFWGGGLHMLLTIQLGYFTCHLPVQFRSDWGGGKVIIDMIQTWTHPISIYSYGGTTRGLRLGLVLEQKID